MRLQYQRELEDSPWRGFIGLFSNARNVQQELVGQAFEKSAEAVYDAVTSVSSEPDVAIEFMNDEYDSVEEGKAAVNEYLDGYELGEIEPVVMYDGSASIEMMFHVSQDAGDLFATPSLTGIPEDERWERELNAVMDAAGYALVGRY